MVVKEGAWFAVAANFGNANDMKRDRQTCLELIPWLSSRYCAECVETFAPEDDPSEDPDARIDLVVRMSDESCFAIEHTQIGPYRDSERDQAINREIQEVADCHAGCLKTGEHVQVHLPIRWEARFSSRKKRLIFAETVLSRLEARLDALRALPRRRAMYAVDMQRIDEVEVHFRYRFGASQTGIDMWLNIGSDLDLERARLERFAEKLPAKLVNLEAWNRRSARTVLVLENFDLQLSNEELVASAVQVVCEANEFAPDLVLYVDSCLKANRWMLPFKLDSDWNWEHFDVDDNQRLFHLP